MSPHATTQDPNAPRFRVRPPANWINDPNGPFRWGDRYHLFYQHNPGAPVHADVHWGHVSSPDLAHWEHHPIALTPIPGGPDEGGCWSGCVVDDNGTPTAVYTGVDHQHIGLGTILLATAAPGDDLLEVWKQEPEPVVAAPPGGLDVTMFRDPFLFTWEGRRWALIGAGHGDGTPSVLVYDCDDLRSWRYAGVFADGRDPLAAELLGSRAIGWECPQLFEGSDGRWGLVVSLWDSDPMSTAYLSGAIAETDGKPRFVPSAGGRLDQGRDFYAPAVLQDRAAGRTLLWGWAWEDRAPQEVAEAGWAGVLTAPREVDVRSDGTLSVRPAPELQLQRAARQFTASPTGPVPLPDAYELLVTAAEPATVGLLTPAEGDPVTLVLDPAGGTVTLDRGGLPRAKGGAGRVTLDAGEPGPLTVRVLVDGSLVEVYAAERATATERLYRSAGDTPELTVEGADVQVSGWELVPPTHG